jgi:cellulose synthase/poly-beta-1,6-N-acetylglucosamine synthase-like glycosyltransferase
VIRRALFWSGSALLAYSLAVFPALVVVRGVLFRREHRTADITPSVSIIVSARNEESAIGSKLDSLLDLDYPADRREIVVASDGSDDATNVIVEQYAASGIRLLALPRVGKAAALNAAVAVASGEVLVFSDANSRFASDALRALVAPLADPEVGGVAGDQRYLPGVGGTSDGERSYWNLDRLLKLSESRAGNAISATGAIYAIRRNLFEPVTDSVTDDFVISTGVIQQGFRLVFAPGAVAYEPVAPTADVEFGRKVRIMTRGLRAVLVRRALLDPRRHGFYALQLLSHKVVRRLMAVPLLAVCLSALTLWRHGPLYRAATLLQATFYGAALVGFIARNHPLGRHRAFALPAFFCLVNAASLLAAFNVVRGRRIDRWEPVRVPDDVRPSERALSGSTE